MLCCWVLLGQVKNQTGHLPVSATTGLSALKLHLPSPAQLYVPRRPRPLTKGSPTSILVKHSPSRGPVSVYCAPTRPCCGMEKSQGKRAGWWTLPLGGPMGHMWSPTPARLWVHVCTTHGPHQVTTLSVNPMHTLHLLPYLTSQKLMASLCFLALKHPSLGFPDTPPSWMPRISQGPDPCEVSSSTTGLISGDGVPSFLFHTLSTGNLTSSPMVSRHVHRVASN